MLCLFSYSSFRLDSAKRAESVFHDLPNAPAAASRTTALIATFRAVIRQDIVVKHTPSNAKPIVTTPVLEIVRITPTQARAIAMANSALNFLGRSELIPAARTGVTVTKKTDRLLESSIVPNTRWNP